MTKRHPQPAMQSPPTRDANPAVLETLTDAVNNMRCCLRQLSKQCQELRENIEKALEAELALMSSFGHAPSPDAAAAHRGKPSPRKKVSKRPIPGKIAKLLRECHYLRYELHDVLGLAVAELEEGMIRTEGKEALLQTKGQRGTRRRSK